VEKEKMTKQSPNKTILLLIIVLGLGVRLLYFFGSPFTPDESTYGLAMVHILNGKSWPVFFYAQPYTGTQSAIIAAGLAKLFGFGPYFLKVIPLVFSTVFIWANYYLAKLVYGGVRLESKTPRKTNKGERVGLAAALLTALLPSFAQNWSVRAGSGYPEVALVGSLCLIIGIKVIYQTNLNSQHQRKIFGVGNWSWVWSLEIKFFILGFLAGLGYWIQPAIAYYLIPLAFLLFLWEPKFFIKRWFYCALLGLVIGAAPVIYYNLVNDLETGRALLNKPGGIKKAFAIFFAEGMPPLLGTRASWTHKDHFLPLALVVWGAYAAAFLVPLFALLRRFRHFIRKIARHPLENGKRVFLESPTTPLVLVTLVVPFIFAASPFNWFVAEPRYIYALYSVLPVLLAGFLLIELPRTLKSFKLFKLPGSLKYLPGILLLLVVSSNILSLITPGKNSRPASFEDVYNVQPVIEHLREHNIKYIYSSYRFCHRLVFESKEDIICTPFEGGFGEWRYPAYKEIVANAPKAEKGFVFLVRKEDEQEMADNYTPALESCKEDLSRQHDSCHEEILGEFRVSWYR
jgi:hypothetical protein